MRKNIRPFTRKQAFTEYLRNPWYTSGLGNEYYVSFPRKLKKKMKRNIERSGYYYKDTCVVSWWNRDMLLAHMPKKMLELLTISPVSKNSHTGTTCRFKRYEKIEV